MKQLGLSAHAKPPAKSARNTADKNIDFSDIPNSTTSELRRAKRVGRPSTGNAKQLIAIRIAPKLLADLRKLAKRRKQPYQSLRHQLLEKGVRDSAA